MIFLKRLLGIILLIHITNYGFSQEFSFYMYFEDSIGNRDSLELGYDENGSLGIDEVLGENNIIGEAYNQLFDVRVTDEVYSRWIGQSMGTYHTKKEIIRKWSEEIIAIDIKSNNYPITATWDSTLFEDQSKGSLITSVPPGGWWDVGSPSDLNKIILRTQSSVTFTDNIRSNGLVTNTYSYTEGLDTISAYWFVFGPEGIGVSTNEMKDTEGLILVPNPSTSSNGVFIRNIGEDKIEGLQIYNFSGKAIREQINNDSFISLEGLKNGFYCIEILMLSGKKHVKKMLVIE